jgi:cardiolipin synthase
MANFFTVLRMLVSPFFAVFMLKSRERPSRRYVALGLFVFGAVTDWADGYVARHTGSVSQFGVTADPLADRLFIGTTLITLYAMRILPLPFMGVVLGRDVVMAAGYPLIGKMDKSKVAVHWTGKVSTAVLFVALGCLVLSEPPHEGSRTGFDGYDFNSRRSWQTYGLWLFAVGMFWSLVAGCVYVSRALAAVKEGGPSEEETPPVAETSA